MVPNPSNRRDAIPRQNARSLEVTGLGVIASLAIAFWSLTGDGTLALSEYLVFAGLLLVSAAGLVWRIVKAAPSPGKNSEGTQQSGA
jgi:hypothetical protein